MAILDSLVPEPERIPDVLKIAAEGSRSGRRLLIEKRDTGDAEGGGSYILKAFDSSDVSGKDAEVGDVREGSIRFRSMNPEFKDHTLEREDEDGVRVIAELVEVLKPE